MDVRIETAPMTAEATILRAVVKVVISAIHRTFVLIEQAVSFSCPDLGSIASNAPNHILKGELARAY